MSIKFIDQKIVLDRILDEAKLNIDKEDTMASLMYDPSSGEIKHLHTNYKSIPFSDHARSQLLTKLNIPASYMNRCSFELQKDNLDYWLNKYFKKKILLRMKHNKVRALFSNRYSVEMDDDKIFPFIFSTFDNLDSKNLRIFSFEKTDDFTKLSLVFNNIEAQYENIKCNCGIAIVNSEVGISALKIHPIVVATINGKIYSFLDVLKNGAVSFRHMGELKRDIIIDSIKEMEKMCQIGIVNLFKSNREIVHPINEIETIVEQSTILDDWLIEIIKDEYKTAEQTMKLNLTLSILEAIKHLPLFKRYCIEKEMGNYLGLFSSTQDQMELIVNDLTNVYMET